MLATDYQVFVSMYQALDAAYDKDRSEKVLSFISDANPNIWKGRTSGDPAVFIEFSESFAKRFPEGRADPKAAERFVREYLSTQNAEYGWVDGDLVASFDSVVTQDLWEQALSEAPE
jgi:hypothetical protein